MSGNDRLEVIVAGGGIAAAEALLALHRHCGDRASIQLLCPNDRLTIPALAVGEPFGLEGPPSIPLSDLCADTGSVHRPGVLGAVDAGARVARTELGEELPFDALLVAVGASAEPSLAGSLTYRGGRDNDQIRALLDAAEAGDVKRIVFAVPTSIQWPFPMYELALLTARELRERDAAAGLTLVTHEAGPLALFGRRASGGARELLLEAGVELITEALPAGVQGGGLALNDGRVIPADRVVASPGLTVAPIEGLPQGTDGFVGTDNAMRVEGAPRVYAAGDVTWFPIKQGGIAAHQADVAASAIASLVDPDIEIEPFRPTLRGVLFTGGAPRYLRAEVGRRSATSADSAAALWWPTAKVAGRYLASYLAKRGVDAPLLDLEPLHGESHGETEDEHREALELALAAADADARWRDYEAALRWLEVAQDLNIALPAEYAEKRREWKAAAGA
jgi:sulfide:quinone oxidoreductase